MGGVLMFFSQREVNLHTHTVFSHHGVGMPSDYVREAEKKGNIRVLGFSEHSPSLRHDFPGERMDMEELAVYRESVRSFSSGDILVLLGAECDWDSGMAGFFRDELLERQGFDYLLGSVHFLKAEDGTEGFVGGKSSRRYRLSDYVESYTEMLSSGLFLYGCHPDIIFASFPLWNEETKAAAKDIIACAVETGMPLEINGKGLRKGKIRRENGAERYLYPVAEFWQMARDAGIKVVTGSDAHKPEYVDSWARLEPYVSSLSISPAGYEIDPLTRSIRIVCPASSAAV